MFEESLPFWLSLALLGSLLLLWEQVTRSVDAWDFTKSFVLKTLPVLMLGGTLATLDMVFNHLFIIFLNTWMAVAAIFVIWETQFLIEEDNGLAWAGLYLLVGLTRLPLFLLLLTLMF